MTEHNWHIQPSPTTRRRMSRIAGAALALSVALGLSACTASSSRTISTIPAPPEHASEAPAPLMSQLPTQNEIRATFGRSATIAMQPSVASHNTNNATPSPGNPCDEAYDTVLAEPWQQDASEAALTDGGTVKVAWHLWQFHTPALASRTMADVAGVGTHCELEQGTGLEGYHVAVSYAAGFENIVPATTNSLFPQHIVWIFVRSGSNVALGIVNTDDKTVLAQMVGVELGTLTR